jgi:phospholipid/cholesterol/gamma-HCH transport system substrate-binding protein
MPARKKRSYDLLLGSFVALGILLLLSVVFLISRERKLFDSTATVRAHFPDVAGLASGADVMLAGVVVGHVKSIEFPNLALTNNDIIVILDISRKYMEFLREDSEASITSKGLLGDKLINIKIGSHGSKPLLENSLIKSTPAMDLNKLVQDMGKTAYELKNIFSNFNQEGGDKALIASVKSMAKLLDNAQILTRDIKNKDGLIHALIYDTEGGDAVKNLSASLRDLQNILRDIKSGPVLGALNQTALNLESVTSDLKNGRGSLGLLLKDPGIYNKLFEILGNLERNRLLKAVIRYGISRPEEK